MAEELEMCIECDEPTGKAGRQDDSFFCRICDKGPFCEICCERHTQNETIRLIRIAATALAWQVEAKRILEDYLADKDTLTLHFERMEALLTEIANADLGVRNE